MTNTKINRVIEALESGEELSANQMRARFGFTTTNAARATVAKLRGEGFSIYTNEKKNSKGEYVSKYRLGNAPRSIISAGYNALREQGINPLDRRG